MNTNQIIKTMENSNELRLPLKQHWWVLTELGIKTEDYREITPYWVKRLTQYEGDFDINIVISALKNEKEYEWLISGDFKYGFCSQKIFDTNVLTLGYPKATDTSKIIRYEHAGIEIRTGNPQWGAEPGKLYFVIKHGKRLP